MNRSFLFIPAIVFAVTTFLPRGFAALTPVISRSDEALPAPRWMYAKKVDPKAFASLSGLERELAQVKAAQVNSNWNKCIEEARSARGKAKSASARGILPWLSIIEIECARSGDLAKAAGKLSSALGVVEKNPVWLTKGPALGPLRQAIVKGYLALLEVDVKNNRARSWKSIEALQELSAITDEKARARLWRLAGELAFSEQKNEAARDFLKRSLIDNEADETQALLAKVEARLAAKPAGSKADGKSEMKELLTSINTGPSGQNLTPAPSATPEVSKEELELVDRITTQLKRGELIPAAEDGVKLINSYPGSSRSKWAADRVYEAYTSSLDKSDSKAYLLRDEIAKRMEGVDGDRMAEWARLLYNRGQYHDSFRLGTKALKSIDGTRRTKVLELTAEAAIAVDRFDAARDGYVELIEKHAGTPSAREAYLRLALVNFRLGNFAQSVVSLERLLALPQIENLELSARYWYWRALQKTKSERADFVAEELMRKFPFSYYGIRARYERNGNILEWKPETGRVESKLWMTEHDKSTFDRIHTLLKAGWLDEAQAEIKELPPALRAEDKALRAVLWSAAAGYINASKLANEAWDEKAELRRPPFSNAAFPSEFDTAISSQAAARKISRFLVKGLIKQESSYNVRAVSTANALGLMQMIPPTAKDIASELKLGSLQLPGDMFEPNQNIQMGTYYIWRMLERYQGNVPLALAAYNAGPARMDRWLKARPSLKGLAALRSGKPEDELWFDEIPYSETSYYVKAILRNILLYKLFETGRVEVSDPVWVN